jgi:hypothetical protein
MRERDMTQPQRDGDEQGSQERQDAAQAIADIVAALQMQRAAVAGVLAQDPAVAPEMLLELARAIDGVVRSSHGLLVQVVARMDEVKAVRGGVATWLTAALGYSPGRARGLASDARRLRELPEVTEQLACGALPVGAERVLARAAQAAVSTERDAADTVADTLEILQRDGMQAAEREVRYLEHAVQPGKAEQTRTRQRTASFLRLSTCESGMLRLEGLLDIERGTLVRAAIDTLVSTWLRERQYDHAAPVPDDVYSTEQLNAEALFRMAKLLLGASDAQRAERTAGTVLFYGPEPGSTAAPVQESAAQLDSPDSADAAPTPGPPGGSGRLFGDLLRPTDSRRPDRAEIYRTAPDAHPDRRPAHPRRPADRPEPRCAPGQPGTTHRLGLPAPHLYRAGLHTSGSVVAPCPP